MTSPDRGGAGAGREVETLILLADRISSAPRMMSMPSASRISLMVAGNILVFADASARLFPRRSREPRSAGTSARTRAQCSCRRRSRDGMAPCRVRGPRRGEELDIVQAGDVRHHRAATDVEEDPVGVQDVLVDPHRVWVSKRAWPRKTVQPSIPSSQSSTPLRSSSMISSLRD